MIPFKKLFGASFLHITFFAGIILFVITGVSLTAVYLIDRVQTRETRQQDSFYRILREYDLSADVFIGTEREMENLNRELDRLERRIIGVESWLSVLKRRRALAERFPPFTADYHASISRAQKAYPSSGPIAAIAAAAIIKDAAVTLEKEEQIRKLLPLIADYSFNNLRLSLHILLGDFRSPGTALKIPYELYPDDSEIINQNLAIVRILDNDLREAAYYIQRILTFPGLENRARPSDDFIRFAAEYHYDFGDLSRSAEIFSLLEDDAALLRQADALFLAGYPASSKALWTILAESINTCERSLYNLAVLAQNDLEASYFLEKLINLDSVTKTDVRQFGLIRYSRTLPHDRALSVLQNDSFLSPAQFPFIDLEICKRNSNFQEPRRRLAEAWLLMDRHYENEDLFWWSAWVMSVNRFYDELDILLKRLDQNNFTNMANFYKAVFNMQEGGIGEAEELLRSIPAAGMDWTVRANLGRILEEQRSFQQALEQYELAAALAEDTASASRIYLRMARCFNTLNRPVDAIMALENALRLDPANLQARLELDRTGF